MSGWDEGSIFYSDQAQFPRGGNGGSDPEQAAPYISKLVKISGITIAASRTKAKATYVTLVCKNCKNVKTVRGRPRLGGAIMPRSFDFIQVGEDSCLIDPWIVIPDRSKYVDQQTLKLQENPEDVLTGELPRNLLLFVNRHLLQTIVPGTSHKGAVAIRQSYIRVVGIEEANEADSRYPANFTADEIGEFKKFSSEGNAYQNICSKIAPSIFGHDDVKKAVSCLLFEGLRKAQGYKFKSKSLEEVLKSTRKMEAKLIGYDEAPIDVTAPVAIPLEKLELQEPS
ncbi:minichromosome maintenance (MCM2/3/5) family protein [Actinidia rufa]|uniref:Minichromosome maintenance (MCM2/3/5) family protein n=1 Tax=Actinidia rufa TaxID=165716 RepID=A0A7J0EIL8_9ERIC|nr:minichromosome maintenance (MCM2/3/5) family protein [Actinidia rufa]